MHAHTSLATAPTPSQTFPSDIDPVRFEVIRNALLAITEEMGATLRRAAYSTNIKTRGDFSCAFFDRDLRTIAQAFAQPSHLGSLAHIVPYAIKTYGVEHLEPGDGILINDPYLGGVHLNDITLITPVFDHQHLFGYVANIAHHVDVGGGAPGSIGVSNEIYQEGLVIPPVCFVKDGQIDLTQCDAQRPSPTNATFSQTYSGVVYVLKCLIDTDIPVNDGFYRLIDIRTRPGSVVAARHPAAVAAGWEVAMQLTALGISPKPQLKVLTQGSGDMRAALKGQRQVWFPETSGFVSCPILDRALLHWGDTIQGPAVIEELDATTVVHPGYQVRVDQYGNLLLQRY